MKHGTPFGLVMMAAVVAGTAIVREMETDPTVNGALHRGSSWWVLVALVLAAGLTPLAGLVARRAGAIDDPGGRKIHDQPTPRLGGGAIYLALAACALVNGLATPELRGVFLASTVVFLVGVLEDVRGVSALVRLVFQAAAVSLLIVSGVALTFLPPTWWGIAGEWALTFLWVIGITNAFNFLDGLDGLAAGSAAINGFFFGVYAYASGQGGLAFLSLTLMAAALGFLPFNYKPHLRDKRADIFLGDSGSTFLGFTLASLAVMGDWAEGSPKDLIVPVLIMAVPVFDMILTTITRFREGLVRTLTEWIAYTGRDHFHHRLLGLGIRKKEAVAIIYLVNVCLGISAFLLKGSETTDALLVLGQVAIIFGIIGYAIVVMRKRRSEAAAGEPPRVATPVSSARDER